MSDRWPDLDKDEADLLRELEALRARHLHCPPFGQLRAAQEGVLPEETHIRVDSHLASCALCRALLHDLASLEPSEPSREEKERIRQRLDKEIGKKVRGASSMSWTLLGRPLAVAGVLAVFALIIVRQGVEPPRPRPAPPLPAAPTETALKLEKPDVKLSAAALVWRGASGDPEQFLKDLAPAFEAFRASNYAEAALRFGPLEQKYPRSIEVFFYGGVSHIFLGQHTQAIASLEKARQFADESFAPDVSWYLALAYHRSGDSARARAALEAVCRGRSTYAGKACAGVRELASGPPIPQN